jgi:S1-C subfamily serine protease
MSVQGLSPADRRELQLPGGRNGAIVTNVTPFGPAAQADIRKGDVILSIMGAPVNSTDDVESALARIGAGRMGRLIVWRISDGQGEQVLVQIRKR